MVKEQTNLILNDDILDAIHDDKLVVFAGAGVSIGEPSNLPDFKTLVNEIAEDTGCESQAQAEESLDHFLGTLHHKGVKVHQRAARLLLEKNSLPNDLHRDLLKLFPKGKHIRLVTTNFDTLFEKAAKKLRIKPLEVYRAPALPLGFDFTGIVHIHGALPDKQNPMLDEQNLIKNLILTDTDFGRAYLTEGWGRRFLVDVFHQFTVLFIGYSYNDVIMNYLKRALPINHDKKHFILIKEEEDKNKNWNLLGLTPIYFKNFKELYEYIKELADLSTRRALNWKKRIEEIARKSPPTDEKTINEVNQTLREIYTTRFFVHVAQDLEWISWLDERKYFNTLFDLNDLNERDKLLAQWLAEYFSIKHADSLFTLIANYKTQLNPFFWEQIAIQLTKNSPLEQTLFKRWVTILLVNIPRKASPETLKLLSQQCTHHNCILFSLKILFTLSRHNLCITKKNSYNQRNEIKVTYWTIDHKSLETIWINDIKPYLLNKDIKLSLRSAISQSLLSGITCQLENIYYELTAWEDTSPNYDPLSFYRATIEPSNQNQSLYYYGLEDYLICCNHKGIDILIDAARDTLEFLAQKKPTYFDTWIENFIESDIPLLRRIAIYAMTTNPNKSADEQLEWLLDHITLYSPWEHHEIYNTVAKNYKTANDTTRQKVIEAICTQPPIAIDSGQTEEQKAFLFFLQFDWLSWLLHAKPDCNQAKAAIEPFQKAHPDWQPNQHSDFNCWIGSVESFKPISPYSVDQLLAKHPARQLENLLNNGQFHDSNRPALISTVSNACQQKPSWAFSLAKVLIKQSLWTSDLWDAVFKGLQKADLSHDEWLCLLNTLDNSTIVVEYANDNACDIAHLLYTLVNSKKPFIKKLLEQANHIALSLWNNIDDFFPYTREQPTNAIMNFWIKSLSFDTKNSKILPNDYKRWFEKIINDTTHKGFLGRFLLARETIFLFRLDQFWTKQNLIPLLKDTDQTTFFSAWEGLLYEYYEYCEYCEIFYGLLKKSYNESKEFKEFEEKMKEMTEIDHYISQVTDILISIFSDVIQQLRKFENDYRNRKLIIIFYTSVFINHIHKIKEFLQTLFQYGSLEDRIIFASCIKDNLQQKEQTLRKRIWDTWLHRYWQNRLEGVYALLDKKEIEIMLQWLPYLGKIFPQASSLAIESLTENQITDLNPCSLLNLLKNLCKTTLISDYPNETAKLIICLCQCASYSQLNLELLNNIVEKLQNIENRLKNELNEVLLKCGSKYQLPCK